MCQLGARGQNVVSISCVLARWIICLVNYHDGIISGVFLVRVEELLWMVVLWGKHSRVPRHTPALQRLV